MAHFAAFARGDGAGHLTEVRELLATNRDVFSPDDSWVQKANVLLADSRRDRPSLRRLAGV